MRARWREPTFICRYKTGGSVFLCLKGLAKHVSVKNTHVSPGSFSFVYSTFFKKVFFFKILTSLFLIEGWLLNNIGFISAIQRHELAIGVRMSLPSWTSLPPPTPAYPSRLLQSPSFYSTFLTHVGIWGLWPLS